jgi:hypothetical protein
MLKCDIIDRVRSDIPFGKGRKKWQNSVIDAEIRLEKARLSAENAEAS